MRNLKFTLFFYAFIIYNISNAQQWGDLTLYSTSSSTTAKLCDTNGVDKKTWTFASGDQTGYSSYMMPGGYLWRSVRISGGSFSGGGMHGKIQKYDYAGNLLWSYTHASTTYNLHHDFCPLPNGNVLMIAYESKTAAEATAAGCSTSKVLWSEKIIEVQPTGATAGTIVWEWHVWDHLVQNVDANKPNYYPNIIDHPELLNINYKNTGTLKDWIHMNGIDYNPMLDQIALSSHNLNEWYIIDHSTTTAEAASHSGGNSGKGGDFLYRWGNPAAYNASGTAVLNVTHDSHWIPEGCPNAGYLVGFNNKGVSSTQSCADMVALPTITNYNYAYTSGQAYAPSTYTNRIVAGGFTSNMGNSQQLPNGNSLICLATAGIIKELGPTGNTLWSKTLTGACAQSFRYDSCFLFNPAPPIPVITETSGTLSSSSATTYQWYMNGALISGATSQNYTPTQNGIYVVRITDSNGCVYQYSVGYEFSMPTGLNEIGDNIYFNIFPNPTNGIVTITDAYMSGRKYALTVTDAVGRILKNEQNVSLVDLSGYGNGIYYVTIKPDNAKSVIAKIVLTK